MTQFRPTKSRNCREKYTPATVPSPREINQSNYSSPLLSSRSQKAPHKISVIIITEIFGHGSIPSKETSRQ